MDFENNSSGFADSLTSGFRWVRKSLPADHVTIGILVFLFGFFGLQINMEIGWFAFGSSLLLFTWHTRMPAGCRALIYLLVLMPVLYWFEKTTAFLFPPMVSKPGTPDHVSTVELIFRYGFMAMAVLGLIIVVRRRAAGSPRVASSQPPDRQSGSSQARRPHVSGLQWITYGLGWTAGTSVRIARNTFSSSDQKET